MTQLIRLFPGSCDPVVRCGLLLTVGLYTGALFLPAMTTVDILIPPGVCQQATGAGDEVALTGQETLIYAASMFASVIENVWDEGPEVVHYHFVNCRALWAWYFRATLPNLLLGLGVICLARGYRQSPWLLSATSLISAASLELRTCWFGSGYSPHELWQADQVGYYYWLASMAVLTAVAAYRAFRPYQSLMKGEQRCESVSASSSPCC
jgi:hypothetical protein